MSLHQRSIESTDSSRSKPLFPAFSSWDVQALLCSPTMILNHLKCSCHLRHRGLSTTSKAPTNIICPLHFPCRTCHSSSLLSSPFHRERNTSGAFRISCKYIIFDSACCHYWLSIPRRSSNVVDLGASTNPQYHLNAAPANLSLAFGHYPPNLSQ